MGLSKTKSFGAGENRIADFAKTLAHPARMAILEFLARQDACMCGDIVDHLPLSESTVSQHLAELKRGGLIKGEIQGPRVCYGIDRRVWDEAREVLSQLLSDVKRCC
jgi:ArsR family transcriptional regulator